MARNRLPAVRLLDEGHVSTWRLVELLSLPATCRPVLFCGHLASPGALLGGVPLKVTQSGLLLPHLCPIRSQASGSFQLGNVGHFHCSHSPFLKFWTEQALRMVHLRPPILAIYSEIPEEKIPLYFTGNFSVHLKLL